MSAQQLQLGIALVLRTHRAPPASLARKLAALKLTPAERRRLQAIASDPNVTRFAGSMAAWRARETLEAVAYTSALLGPERIRALWESERTALAECDDRRLAEALLGRLAKSRRLSARQRAVAAYERELLALLEGQVLAVPRGSRLAHGNFRIVRTRYDVPAYARALEEGKVRPPRARAVTALLVADADTGFRVFEIDAQLRRFLKGELGLGPRRKALPPAYRDLVELGLCRAG